LSSSLKQLAYQHLRKRMLSGHLPPGQRISPDASARELGMSQTPVREAIGLLESEGLVEQLPNLGAFVRIPTRREIADLSDLRMVLEGFAVYRAAKRIKPAKLRELEKTFERMRELAHRIRDGGEPAFRGKLSDEIALVDVEFHMILLRAAGNERMLKIIDDLHVLSRLMSFGREFTVQDVTKEMATLIKLHGKVLQSIRKRDGKAARKWMMGQLKPNKKILLDRYDTWQASRREAHWAAPLIEDIRRKEKDLASPPRNNRQRPRKREGRKGNREGSPG